MANENNELLFILYRVTCLISGKSYIGQTKSSLAHRWQQHCHNARRGYKRGCRALQTAITAYGEEAFVVEELGRFPSRADVNDAEVQSIAKFGTLAPGGYNLDSGGGAIGRSEETKDKIRAAIKVSWQNGKYASIKSPLLDPSIAARVRDQRLAAGNYGRKPGFSHTEETREKMKAAWVVRRARSEVPSYG